MHALGIPSGLYNNDDMTTEKISHAHEKQTPKTPCRPSIPKDKTHYTSSAIPSIGESSPSSASAVAAAAAAAPMTASLSPSTATKSYVPNSSLLARLSPEKLTML